MSKLPIDLPDVPTLPPRLVGTEKVTYSFKDKKVEVGIPPEELKELN